MKDLLLASKERAEEAAREAREVIDVGGSDDRQRRY